MIQRKPIQWKIIQKIKEKLKIRIRLIIPAGKVWDPIPKEDQINEKGENQDALVFALMRFILMIGQLQNSSSTGI